MTSDTCRHTDPMTGIVAEVGTDGVPVGLALPEEILDRAPTDVARAVLRTLTAAACEARDLLDRLAEQEWDGQDWDRAEWDDPEQHYPEQNYPDQSRAGIDDGPIGGTS
ncbi:hypothetical protein [Dietzia psychralcaliphila]|uniref:hypothetical protein n=1 Tax=Dietzia psychralcaliphila TaxID=139021 RepID=UPI0020A6C06D|nr:hypothetical protein [Dietzia psychralcaliphila]